jgi:hypothetical protein
MTQMQRSRFAVGIILVVIGGFLLVVNFVPNLSDWISAHFEWPVWMIAGGVAFLIIGLLSGLPGFAIPAAIVAGIGGILYWQVLNDDFASWSYMWALIPGFTGVGTVIMGLVSSRDRSSVSGGFVLILISLAMFALFGSMFGGLVGVTRYWPVLLIIYGASLLIRMLFRRN